MENTVLLVDGSSYLYRAFFALKAPLTSPRGEAVGALFGILKMLKRIKTEIPHRYAALVFDAKGKNFRHELYPEYKANRPPMPQELRLQIDWVHELAQLYGWKVIMQSGVEADDILATLAYRAKNDGMNVVISTGDKDLAQLVDAQITLIDTMKNVQYDNAAVFEKFGVRPDQIVDFLTLTGDTSDNVPGVHKCGAKTAAKWLEQYETLDNLIAHHTEIGGKIGQSLAESLAHLPLSKQLITLKKDVEIADIDLWNDFIERSPSADLINRLEYFGFHSLIQELQRESNIHTQPLQAVESPHYSFEVIDEPHKMDNLCTQLAHAQSVGLAVLAQQRDTTDAPLVGIALAWAEHSFYIPLYHAPFLMNQAQGDAFLARLKPFLENPKIAKIGHDTKTAQHILRHAGVALCGVKGDAMLASYLVHSHMNHHLESLIEQYDTLTLKYETLCGKGAKEIAFSDVDENQAAQYAAQMARCAYTIEKKLKHKMNDAQRDLYDTVELPLSQILFEMECTGIALNKNELNAQSRSLQTDLDHLQHQIFTEAGREFNVNSPKQLQEVLFTHLNLPTQGIKKTASGGYSTDESVLEKLAEDFTLPRIILQYRSLTKLKSTYTDRLPEQMGADGRVHTHFAQAVAVTGRLSSSNPNLQNIPVRTCEGRKIRRAFVASEGCRLISADYSQIELRIMAYLSGDETLCEAFAHNEDVHRHTAAQILGLAPEEVTPEQRRSAKTINFGLIYGMSAFGLAKALNVTNIEAKHFIDLYFARYPAVAEYMNRATQQVKNQGFVETAFGRRLYLPRAQSARERAANERAAINAPMQGTAADLIKKAMIAVHQQLKTHQLNSRLILQVHDELILEVPENEREFIQQHLPQWMTNIVDWHVPLLVELGCALNWDEAH